MPNGSQSQSQSQSALMCQEKTRPVRAETASQAPGPKAGLGVRNPRLAKGAPFQPNLEKFSHPSNCLANATYSSSRLAHASRSCATFCQTLPHRWPNAFMSSSHLLAGRPTRRLAEGTQSNVLRDHRPSSLLAKLPAHRHFTRICSSTQSATFARRSATSC